MLHDCIHGGGFAAKLFRRGGVFLGSRGRSLRDVFHLLDTRGDLLDTASLILAGLAHSLDQRLHLSGKLGDTRYGLGNFLQIAASLA